MFGSLITFTDKIIFPKKALGRAFVMREKPGKLEGLNRRKAGWFLDEISQFVSGRKG
jgi:hypothetical protein